MGRKPTRQEETGLTEAVAVIQLLTILLVNNFGIVSRRKIFNNKVEVKSI